MTGLWLAIPVVVVLFFFSSFRLLYLGWKTIEVTDQYIEFSAPFWFTTHIEFSELERCETIKTDSLTVESEAGLGFEAHRPRLAQVYRWARLLGRFAYWFNRTNRRFAGSSVASSGNAVAAPLLAIRFWFCDGTRAEFQIPDEPKVTPELIALLATITEGKPLLAQA